MTRHNGLATWGNICTPTGKFFTTGFAFVTTASNVLNVTATRTASQAALTSYPNRLTRKPLPPPIPQTDFCLVLNSAAVIGLMNQRGFKSLKELADVANVSHTTVKQVVAGKARPSATVVGKLARALGTHPTRISEWGFA